MREHSPNAPERPDQSRFQNGAVCGFYPELTRTVMRRGESCWRINQRRKRARQFSNPFRASVKLLFCGFQND